MSRRPYIPTQWNGHEREFLLGWKDAEFGLELGTGAKDPHGAPLTDRLGDCRKSAYEAGYAAYQRKHAALRGGA